MAGDNDESNRVGKENQRHTPKESGEVVSFVVGVVTWSDNPGAGPSVVLGLDDKDLDRQLATTIHEAAVNDDVPWSVREFLREDPVPSASASPKQVKEWLEDFNAHSPYPQLDRFLARLNLDTDDARPAWWEGLAHSPVPDILEDLFPQEPRSQDFLTPEGTVEADELEDALSDWRDEVLTVAHALAGAPEKLQMLAEWETFGKSLGDLLTRYPMPPKPHLTDFRAPGPNRQGGHTEAHRAWEQSAGAWALEFFTKLPVLLSDTLGSEPAPRAAVPMVEDQGTLLGKLREMLDGTTLPEVPTPQGYLTRDDKGEVTGLDLPGFQARMDSWRSEFVDTARKREGLLEEFLSEHTPTASRPEPVSLERGALLSDLLAKRQAEIDQQPEHADKPSSNRRDCPGL